MEPGSPGVHPGVVAARHAHPVLRRGSYRTVAAAGAAIAFVRSPVDGVSGPAVVVAINAGEAEASLQLDLPGLAGQHLVALSWPGMPAVPAGRIAVEGGHAVVTVPPRAGLVLRAEGG